MPSPRPLPTACPMCGDAVDPLRAGAVGVFGSRFVYFCSEDCKAAFTGKAQPLVHPQVEPAIGEPDDRPERSAETSEAKSSGAETPARTRSPAEDATFEPTEDDPGIGEPPGSDDDEPPSDGEIGDDAPSAHYVPATVPAQDRFDWATTVLCALLLGLGVLAAAGIGQRWVDWLSVPSRVALIAAAAAAGALGLAGLLDLVRGRGRGVDHICVGLACGALALSHWLDDNAAGVSHALAVAAVYGALTVVERRLLSQRPPWIAPVSEGPPPDEALDWGGPRGPLAAGLRRAVRFVSVVPLAAGGAAATLAALADVLPGWQASVPILVVVALALLPWSVRNAAIPFGALARAAARVDCRFLDPASVESAARVHGLVFLHRGVVTRGRPEVVQFVNYSAEPDDVVLDRAASVERTAAGTPLADAVIEYAGRRGVAGRTPTRLGRYWPGRGVKATSEQGETWIGGRRMMLEEGISTGPFEEDARQFEQGGQTVVFLAVARRVHAVFGIADPLHPDMPKAVAAAHDLGLETHLVTGESRLTAEYAARELKVRHVRPELTPEERAAEIRSLRETGGAVAVVGRPSTPPEALQEADVAVAISAADPSPLPWEIVVAADGPDRAVAALAAARRTTASLVGHLVLAGAAVLLDGGLSVLGFVPPPGTIAIVAGVALLPLLRKPRIRSA